MIIREELCIQQPADLMRRIMQRKTEIMLRPLPCTCLIKKQKWDHTSHFQHGVMERAAFIGTASKNSWILVFFGNQHQGQLHHTDSNTAAPGKKKNTEHSRESCQWHHATDCLIAFLRRNEHSLDILGLNHRQNHKICFRASKMRCDYREDWKESNKEKDYSGDLVLFKTWELNGFLLDCFSYREFFFYDYQRGRFGEK